MDEKQEYRTEPQEPKVSLRPEEMPEFQNPVAQAGIRYGRKMGQTDEQIIDGLRAFL